LILIAALFPGCGRDMNRANKFYVGECSGGYCVYVYAWGDDSRITKPMSVIDADKLTNELNAAVGNRFAGALNTY
jgi:hypothetical protein